MSVAMKLTVFAAVLALSLAADENNSESDRDKKEVYGASSADNGYYNPNYSRYNTESRYLYDQQYTGYPGHTGPSYYNDNDNNYNSNADPRYYNNVGAYYDPRYSGTAAAAYPGYYNRYTPAVAAPLASTAAAAAYPGYYNRYTPAVAAPLASTAAAAAYPGYYNHYTPGRYTGDKYSAGHYDPAHQGYNAAYRAPYTGYSGYYLGAYPAVPAAAAAAIAPYRKV
ncbi:shematrin-like protein 1 [Anabrus simplex]|uniref:shematrin-like protein 1 n=1 Tax=Anabrus simplex TaxID=316456 RepID=UPI0035A2A006